jgi:hypothetical protein
MRDLKLLKGVVFIFVFGVILCRWWNIPITDDGYARSWFYGDSFSDRNVMSTVQFYHDSGFDAGYAYLPVLFYKDTSRPVLVYTHYPGLPDLTATVVSQVTGIMSARKLMLLPIALSMLLFFLIFYTLQLIVRDRLPAFIGAVFLLASNYFICWADDLHQHVYVELVKWLYICLAYRFYNSKKFRAGYFAALFMLYFLAVWISFEPVVFLAIVTLGFSYIFKKKLVSLPNFILLCSPVIGFGLHLLQNYAYLHSWQAVMADMTKAVVHRTSGNVSYNEVGHVLGAADILRAIALLLLRIGKFYWINGLALVALMVFVFRRLKQDNPVLLKVLVVLLLASVSWHFVMPQHAMVHMFTLRHYATAFAIVFGVGMVYYFNYIRVLRHNRSVWLYAVHMPLIIITVVYAGYEQLYLAILKYSLVYPAWGKDLTLLFWI